jgi:transcriptional antiterminator RfaH
MPLLPLEPFVYPEDMLVGPYRVDANGGVWWVVHTKPRAEKALARRLLGRAIKFFLPLYKRQWRSRGRLLGSFMPLFPGYVFFHGDAQIRLEVLQTNMAAQILRVDNQTELHADLVRIYQLIASNEVLTPERRVEVGSLVQITAGSLAGLQGKVLRRGSQLRFFVEVQFLHQGVSVEIESWMIEPLQPAAAKAASLC